MNKYFEGRQYFQYPSVLAVPVPRLTSVACGESTIALYRRGESVALRVTARYTRSATGEKIPVGAGAK
jgi:hypothetical protein